MDFTVVGIEVTSEIRVPLANGREITAPIVSFPRLQQATPAQRSNWRLIVPKQGMIGNTSRSS
jgi:hypothetical protein